MSEEEGRRLSINIGRSGDASDDPDDDATASDEQPESRIISSMRRTGGGPLDGVRGVERPGSDQPLTGGEPAGEEPDPSRIRFGPRPTPPKRPKPTVTDSDDFPPAAPYDNEPPGPDVEDPTVSPPTVFISYRYDDTGDVVPMLADRLRRDLTSKNVFRDKDDLIGGERWDERVIQEIQRRDTALFVVGERWAEAGDLTDPNDPVKLETELVLAPATGTQPIPVLLDIDRPPPSLPPAIEPLFKHHAPTLTRDEIGRPSSVGYQGIIISVWNAVRRQNANGVLVIGDGSAAYETSLDNLVEQMKSNKGAAERLSRLASGADLLTCRPAEDATEPIPDVIFLVGDDISEEEEARIKAARLNPGIKIAVAGGAIAAAAAAGITIAALAGPGTAPVTYASVAQLASTYGGGQTGMLSSVAAAWQSAAMAVKVAVVAPLAVAGGLAVNEVLSEPDLSDLPDLAGAWVVDDFDLVTEGNVEEGDFDDISADRLVFETVDPGCSGGGCSVRVVEGPDFLVNSTLTPNDDRLESDITEDKTGAIRRITGSENLACGGRSISTDLVNLTFSAERAGDEIEFRVRIDTAEPGCEEAALTWTSTAVRE